jgi:hypothetical protein
MEDLTHRVREVLEDQGCGGRAQIQTGTPVT